MDAQPRKSAALVVLIPILLLAFNLRPVAASVGPVLGDISHDLAMSGTAAGLLTSLPALCFAGFGAIAPGLARRWGDHATVAVALLALTTGQVARAFASNAVVFLGLSVLALAGMAICNVLVPSLVRTHFPNRIGLATSLYSLSLALGVTLASIGVVPLALALGGWRGAFAAAASTAVAALLCWLPMLRFNRNRRRVIPGGPRHYRILDVARTRIGWAMALYFAIQSAQAYSVFGWLPSIYMDAGMSQVSAGFMLGITTGLGVIPAFLVPVWVGRVERPVGMLMIIQVSQVAGFLGLMLAPMTLPWLWAGLLAIGLAGFPFFLTLIGMRARTASGTAVLSGFSQSVGYALAATGPLAVGVVHEYLQDWTIPILMQLSLVVPMTVFGLAMTKPWFIEDKME